MFSCVTLAACSGGSGGVAALPSTNGSGTQSTSRSVASSTTAASFVTEQAQPAGKFYDEFGVNIHLSETNTAYGNFQQVLSQMRALGIKNFRDAIPPNQSYLCSENQQLGSAGMHGVYIVPANSQKSDLDTMASCAGSALGAFEGPNEWDIMHPNGDNNWVAEVQGTMRTIHSAARQSNDSLLRGAGIIGPAFANGSAYQAVGDLSSFVDVGNMHDYFNGRNPGTYGYGDNGYGSVVWNMNNSRPSAQSRSIISTETGWGHTSQANGGNTIDEWAAALYTNRLFFEHFNDGVPQTYVFELYDDPTAGGFSNYGLIRGDGSGQPYWAYWAVKNLTTLISDPYSASTSSTLTYNLSGNLANIHHTLLHKQDGSMWLALWHEAETVDPNSGKYNNTPTQSVTVTLQSPAKSATFYQSLMSTNAPASQQVDSSQPMTFSIGDEVSLLRLGY